MCLKLISIRPPWADAIACGAKRFETRSFGTSHRGALGIHAGAGDPLEILHCLQIPEFQKALSPLVGTPLDLNAEPTDHGVQMSHVHRGAIVAVCRLEMDFPMWELHPRAYRHEERLGDFGHGRHAWMLTNVVRLEHPVPCHGQLGLFNCKADLRRQIWDALPQGVKVDPVIMASLVSPRAA